MTSAQITQLDKYQPATGNKFKSNFDRSVDIFYNLLINRWSKGLLPDRSSRLQIMIFIYSDAKCQNGCVPKLLGIRIFWWIIKFAARPVSNKKWNLKLAITQISAWQTENNWCLNAHMIQREFYLSIFPVVGTQLSEWQVAMVEIVKLPFCGIMFCQIKVW